MQRRSFLQGSLATSTLLIAAGAGLLQPGQVVAADYPKAAFDKKAINEALNTFMGVADAADSGDITLIAPDQAENGASVPVKVSVNGKAEAIAVVVEGNIKPLVIAASIGADANSFLSGRIKMGESSLVTAYAKTDGGLIKTGKQVKVTVGGCS